MALLPKSSKTPRTPKPRVFLSREENKQVNALKSFERKVLYGLAAYATVCLVMIQALDRSQTTRSGALLHPWWHLAISLVLVAVYLSAIRFGNRFFAGIGAMAVVYGPTWGTRFVFAAPLFAVMLWMTLRISNDRRRIIEDRVARGDLGVDPRTAARRRRAESEKATSDSTGKAVASASKRYTPPKARKK